MTLASLVNQFVDLINLAIPVIIGVGIILFLYTVVHYIAKAGDAQGKNAERTAMLWGLVALFVLFSIWGIINIFRQMLPYASTPSERVSPETELY